MKSVNLAEPKNRLSRHLNEVRAGEEIVIGDRDVAIARIVPLTHSAHEDDELKALAAGRKRRLGELAIDDSFWELHRGLRLSLFHPLWRRSVMKTKRQRKAAAATSLTAFWDTSGIVPLCCFQPQSAQARQTSRNLRSPGCVVGHRGRSRQFL